MKYKIETEREELFEVNPMIAMCVKLDREVRIDEARAAFKCAVKAHEILGSKVVIEESGEAYYVDCDVPLSFIDESSLSFEELICENERHRFLIEKGEYIRVFLSPSGVVFLMHHIAGDGRSLLFFIETFLSCLSGETPEFVPFSHTTLKDLPDGGQLPFLYRQFVSSYNRKWIRERRVFGFEDLDKAFTDFWKSHKTSVEINTLSPEAYEAVLNGAREAGCSVTYYLTACRLNGRLSGKVDIGMAIDCRTDETRSMGNHVGGVNIVFDYDAHKSVGHNAKLLQEKMRERVRSDVARSIALRVVGECDPTLIDAMCLSSSDFYDSKLVAKFAEAMAYGTRKRDVGISNLMRADIRTSYGNFGVEEIIFVPPVVSYNVVPVGIITVGEKLAIAEHRYV